jgi:undecaprenyl-diphosphatase
VHDPISYFQAVILGIIQGVAEPFPISSLGHAVVLPRLFGWNIHQNDGYFLSFLVALHLATAIVLLVYFWRDWVRIVRGLLRSLATRKITAGDTDARLGWLLVAGTIPVGLIGLGLQTPLQKLFASAVAAACFLIVNGVALLVFERVRARPPAPGDWEGDSDERIARLSFLRGGAVGLSQAAALLPGISRSGFSMGGGLLCGHQGSHVRGQALVGALCAAAVTVLAVRVLLRYLTTNRLQPFGVYCIALGAVCLVAFAL